MINDVLQVWLKARWTDNYLDAMKGVMSNSSGKETYVVIFRRSFAECSNRWGEAGERRSEEENGKMESGRRRVWK